MGISSVFEQIGAVFSSYYATGSIQFYQIGILEHNDQPTYLESSNDDYPGPRPFSEKETQAVRDFVLSRKKRSGEQTLKAFIDVQAYGQLWLYPYSDRKRNYPDDIEDLVWTVSFNLTLYNTMSQFTLNNKNYR